MPIDLKQLEQKIIDAFQDISYPGDENIIPENPYGDLEANRVKEFFSGKSWQDINIHILITDYIGDHSACLSFMTPEAFRYYLPSYILISIRNHKEAEVTSASLMYKLTRGFMPAGGEEWFDERIECFSDEIKKAIAEFIWTMYILHGDERSPREIEAFQSYWYQYYDPKVSEER